jgi:hypothetical protein
MIVKADGLRMLSEVIAISVGITQCGGVESMGSRILSLALGDSMHGVRHGGRRESVRCIGRRRLSSSSVLSNPYLCLAAL